MNKASIIVPVYQVEPYLCRCIDSILAQTFTDFELILVDDGSPDRCPMICDEYAKNDERIRVIHKKNGGLSSARNAGMEAAQGKYFLFCDSDDYVSPHWCETLVKQIKTTPNAWIYCDLIRAKASGRVYGFERVSAAHATKTNYYKAYVMGLSAYAWNKIYSAEIIKQNHISFCETKNIFEDVDFNLKYLQYCSDCMYVSE